MNTTPASQLGPNAENYLGSWTQNIAQGLTQFLGAGVVVESVELPQPADGAPEAGLWIRLFGGKAGEQAFFLPEPDALRMGKLLLGGPSGETATLGPEGRESVVQFFQQIATMIPVAGLLGAGSELEVSEAERPVWENAGQAAFRFFTAQDPGLSLRAWFSSDFLGALESAQETAKAPEKKPNEKPEQKLEQKPGQKLDRKPSEGPSRVSGSPHDINLDLLMDVELEVTLRFGQREMLLGDILKLAAGSVVELDQEVQDPVELLVGSKVIAWGEVVTVDGSYGLRITGLASREERLESLRK